MTGIEIPFADAPVQSGQSSATNLPEREIPPSYSEGEISATFVYCEEVECALVSLLWWNPDLIPITQRELDFQQHFVSPAHRGVLEALTFAYAQMGDVSWAAVIEMVRQLGLNDEVGGLAGLNDILTNRGRHPEGPPKRNLDLFLSEYIRAVKTYASGRKANPFTAPSYYVDGAGTLRRNKLALKSNDPVCAGTIRVLGHTFAAAGWWGEDGELR
jgi:hypothetical protein